MPPYQGDKVELLEGGRVVATLYPQRRILWIWADCASVRAMLKVVDLDPHLLPARECNSVHAIKRNRVGRIMGYMKAKAQ